MHAPLAVFLHRLRRLRVDADPVDKVAQLTQQRALLTQHHLAVRGDARPRRHGRQLLAGVILNELTNALQGKNTIFRSCRGNLTTNPATLCSAEIYAEKSARSQRSPGIAGNSP